MSLKVKLPLVVSILVLLSAAGVGYFLIRHEQRVLSEELYRRGELLAEQLAGVDKTSFNSVATQAERLRLADSTTSLERSPSYFEKERTLLAALSEITTSPGVLHATLFDWNGFVVLSLPESTSVEFMKPADGFTFISPLTVRRDTLGFAQVRIDPALLDSAIKDALGSMWPVLAGIIGASILLSLLFSMFFTIPISRLKKHALELSNGDLTARVKIRSRDELGLLGRVFNKMAHNLQLTYDELKEKLIEVRRLFKMATEDGLTGLYVKRYFLELLTGEVRRSIRYDRPLSLLMCDIDHFKLVNDTYGHPVGDAVLRSIARRLSSATREGIDLIGRYGGEEFAVMLPETDEQTAWRVAERLRNSIDLQPIYIGDVEGVKVKEISVTLSIGVTTIREEASMEKLIATADRALYISKESGRNRSTSLALER